MADLSPEQLQSLADALTGASRASNDLTKEQNNQIQRQKALQDSIDKTRSYLADLGSTLISTERGTTKYTGAVTGAADAAANVANKFGILGMAAGAVIKALGGLAAASLKQNDAFIKTFKTLSEFGAIDLDPKFESLNEQLLKLGYTAETSQEFANILRKIAPEMAMLGGTVKEGTKAFVDAGAKLTGPDMQKQLYNLGYTNEQILDYAGSFIARNTKNQTLLDKSTGNLANQSFGYLKTLTELTALTGASRDQAEEAAKAQQLELGWRLHIAEVAKRSPEEAKKLQESMQYQLLMNKDMAMTVMDQIVNNGAITTQNSARNMNLVGDTYLRTIELSKRQGNDAILDTANLVNNQLPAIDAHIAQFSDTAKKSTEAGRELGVTIGLLDTRAKLAGINDKTIANLRQQINDMISANNTRLGMESEEEQAQRKRREMAEKATRVMGDYMVPGVTKFSILINQAGLALAKFVRFTTGGMVDFVDNFRTFNDIDEVKEALDDYKLKELELVKKRTEAEKDLQDALDDRKRQEDSYKNSKMTAEEKAKSLEGVNKAVLKAREKLNEVDSAIRGNRISVQQAEQVRRELEQKNATKSQNTPVIGAKGSSFEGIRLKPGAHTEGEQLDPRIPGLAKDIARLFPDAYITSINDEFHRTGNIDPATGKVRPSKHKTGEALDFALGYRPGEEEGNRIVDQLIGLGFKKARDEYNHPLDGTTAGHFHAELATGGIVRGPKTGYPAMLHGTEAVLPMNMFKDFGNMITKFPFTSGSSTPGINDMDSLLRIMEQVYSKLEEMVDYQRATKFVQDDILVQVKH